MSTDVLKANLCMAGIVGVFVLLTLLAYLLTEGKSYCIIPILRKTCPTCAWVKDYDNVMDEGCQKSLALKPGVAQHVLGVKRPYLQV